MDFTDILNSGTQPNATQLEISSRTVILGENQGYPTVLTCFS